MCVFKESHPPDFPPACVSNVFFDNRDTLRLCNRLWLNAKQTKWIAYKTINCLFHLQPLPFWFHFLSCYKMNFFDKFSEENQQNYEMFKTIKCLPSDPHPQRCKQAVELALGLKSIYFNSNLCYFSFDKMYSELFCVYRFLLLCKRFCILCFVRENGL